VAQFAADIEKTGSKTCLSCYCAAQSPSPKNLPESHLMGIC